MNHIEDQHQEALFDWSKITNMPDDADIEKGSKIADYLYSIPNGMKTSARIAARFKRQGMKAGVFDVALDVARGGYFGLKIELKIKPNKPTENQKAFEARTSKAGYMCKVCYHWTEARDVITEYLKLKPTKEYYET